MGKDDKIYSSSKSDLRKTPTNKDEAYLDDSNDFLDNTHFNRKFTTGPQTIRPLHYKSENLDADIINLNDEKEFYLNFRFAFD